MEKLLPVNAGKQAVLLIDDHAVYWRPFFSRIAKTLNCTFYFSLDGKYVYMDNGVEKDIDLCLPFFDVIILDIIIGDKKNGLDILANIRKSLPNMPIVITSTTLDPDLAVSMRCANGFIYKKQINFEKTAALLSSPLRSIFRKRKRVSCIPEPSPGK
jgi:DNA-binding NarL/FixJ family response regulator